MIGLWVAAAILAAGAGALMLWRAARGQAGAADPSLGVYRRALAEIDDLAARDLLPPDERRLVRAEAARRLLNASDHAPARVRTGGPAGPLAAAVLVAVSAAVIYSMIGSPSLPDQPFAVRLAAWRAHPEQYPPTALAAALGAIADERPRDIEPLRRLAALDLSLGDGGGAVHALRRAMALAPDRADIPAMLGEVMVLQGGGVLSPDARALFARAAKADPAQGAARYYLAKAKIVDGDVAGGLSDWRALLATLAANDPRRAGLAGDISQVEKTGAIAPPAAEPTASAPSAEMSAAIRGMVDGLAARLQAQPNDPGGWVRLVRAYGVLGEHGKRDVALAAARARFAGRPDVLGQLDAAAHAARGTIG
jgi:cytochrome c-type biogenesis protein CcmH